MASCKIRRFMPLTQVQLQEMADNLSDFEADDISDLSEDDIIIEDFREELESEDDLTQKSIRPSAIGHNFDGESDDENIPLSAIRDNIGNYSGTQVLQYSQELNRQADFEKATVDDNVVEQEELQISCEHLESESYLHIEKVPVRLRGKDGFRWSGQKGQKTFRTPKRNLVIHLPGNKGSARTVGTASSAWNLFFTSDILNNIVTYTNFEIAVQRIKYSTDRPTDDEYVAVTKIRPSYIRDTDVIEIKALIGLFYYAGVMKMGRINTQELFDRDTGIPFFRATMSEARFNFLTNCLRFDDKATRKERRETDRFAPIRGLFEQIVSKGKELYTPYQYCTLDEQLVGFRGRCPFKMYIPSKPDKYGIKIVTFCDAKTFYLLSAEVYTGKGSTPQNTPVAEYYALKLTQSIHGTNRNVTMDNWFTAFETVRKLYSDHSVTVIGTVKKNKAQIPPLFLETKGRKKNSAMFAYSNMHTLLSYCPPKKKKKIVLLSSSMHPEGDKPNTVKLPEIIEDYNKTKGGVDSFDQLTHGYTVARKTRRWPLRIFYNLLDSVGINAYILLNGSRAPDKETFPNRRSFLKKLGLDLIRPLMTQRLEIPTLHSELRQTIQRILKIQPEFEDPIPRQQSSGRCNYCPRNKDRKSRTSCALCKKFICLEHQIKVCPNCAKK